MAEDPAIRRHGTSSANSFCSLFYSADSSCSLSKEAHNQERVQPVGKVRQAEFNVSASEDHHASVGLKPRSFLVFGGFF